MGVSVEATEPDIALPGCTYGVPKADTKYLYSGVNDCRAAALLAGVAEAESARRRTRIRGLVRAINGSQ